MDLRLVQLDLEQIEKVYKSRMVHDFPVNELRPLDMTIRHVKDGRIEFYGLMDGDSLAGYVSFVKNGDDYLVDYLAIMPDRRNDGMGAKLLELLAKKLSDASSIIGEVEDPICADNEASEELQSRRLNFYLRNGLRDTGVKTKTFGADFIILEMGKHTHSTEEIKALYRKHYKSMLPRLMFWMNIRIK